MKIRILLVASFLTVYVAACQGLPQPVEIPSASPTAPPVGEPMVTAPPVPAAETPGAAYPPPVTAAPPTLDPGAPYPGPGEGTTAPGEPERPLEAIFIQSPASGSRLSSPIILTGEADSTFEQNLGVRLLSSNGSVIHETYTTIQSNLGQRGPFSLEIPFSIAVEEQVFIQVFSSSARDGGITHLNSVGLTLIPSGPQQINTAIPQPERIAIFSPVSAATLQGGVVQIEGFALASFEQTLLVELLDENGETLSAQPVMVQAPDLGLPGPFSASLSYSISQPMPGRVVVRDISPAHGGDSHLSSVEVRLEP